MNTQEIIKKIYTLTFDARDQSGLISVSSTPAAKIRANAKKAEALSIQLIDIECDNMDLIVKMNDFIKTGNELASKYKLTSEHNRKVIYSYFAAANRIASQFI